MTRDEILAMEPGRELDALVAEKVMGWTHYREEWGGVVPDSISHYSTDISAAWEVVEKMGPFTQLTADIYNGITVWHCSFSVVDSVDAVTAPEAICKAALLAALEVTE